MPEFGPQSNVILMGYGGLNFAILDSKVLINRNVRHQRNVIPVGYGGRNFAILNSDGHKNVWK